VMGRVKVGDNPHGVVLDDGTHRLFVNNAKSDSVSVIDVAKLTVVATVAPRASPSTPSATSSTPPTRPPAL